MSEFTIVLGNKAYSSWSLRGWLMLKLTGAVFDEVVVPLDRPETKAAIRAHSPSGRVPTLKAGGLAAEGLAAEGLAVWDTLAIAEYLHERFPEAGLWPEDPAARACARSIAAEMHAGFPILRARLPMDLKREPPEPGGGITVEGALAGEIARIVAIWSDCRARSGSAGDFLFGRFGVADAFYAPVATRFVTYGVTLEGGVALEGAAADYRDALVAWPDLRDWIAAAKAEPWVIGEP